VIIQYASYYHPSIETKNMHSSMVILIETGTRMRMRDRNNDRTWLEGFYEERRWPEESGSWHGGIVIDDGDWSIILDDDEVEIIFGKMKKAEVGG